MNFFFFFMTTKKSTNSLFFPSFICYSSSISCEMDSLNASTRAKNVDYSPLLRHICRSEKAREISRRTSRSHYLRHHFPGALDVNEFFSTQCSVLQEDN